MTTTAQTNGTVEATFRAIAIGDEIELDYNGKARRVVVTGIDARHVYTTSGRVVGVVGYGSRFPGGSLTDYGLGYGIQYQPTMAQQVKRVTGLRIVRRAAERN